MPLEGHWQRINTPIRAEGERNTRIVAILGALTLAAAVVLTVFAIARPGHDPVAKPGCLDVSIAGIMGNNQLKTCGQRAIDACNVAAAGTAPAQKTIVAACRRSGIL